MKEINKVYEFLLKEKNNMKEVSFAIENMVCQGCAEKITDILKEIKGVENVKTQAMKKLVNIKYSASVTDENELTTILTKAGYTPTKK